MNLNVCNLGERNWFDFKSDILFGLFYSFQSLGYDTTLDHNRPSADRLNVLVGTDQVPQDPVLAELFTQSMKSDRFDYCVFETEIFTGRTINLRENFDVDLYLEILRGARFIFTPFLHNVRVYADIGIDAQYLRWGANRGVRVYQCHPSVLQFDACFVGTTKGLRAAKLARLKRSMDERLISVDSSLPYEFREYAEVNAACILSIDYAETGFPVNPFRIERARSNGKLVIHDHQYDEDGYTNGCIRVQMRHEEIAAALEDNRSWPDTSDYPPSTDFEDRLRDTFSA